jgi:hypothetical protein
MSERTSLQTGQLLPFAEPATVPELDPDEVLDEVAPALPTLLTGMARPQTEQ